MNANMTINNILNVIQYATSVEGVKKKPLDDPGAKGLRANELFTWLLDTKPNNYSRNRKAMSRLLKCLPVALMHLRYLQCDDPEHSKHKHSENDNNTDSSSNTLATTLDMDFPREKFVGYLKACIFVLYELRNYFSHHDHEMYKLEDNSDNTTSTKSHLYFLYTLLTANIRTVKARFIKMSRTVKQYYSILSDDTKTQTKTKHHVTIRNSVSNISSISTKTKSREYRILQNRDLHFFVSIPRAQVCQSNVTITLCTTGIQAGSVWCETTNRSRPKIDFTNLYRALFASSEAATRDDNVAVTDGSWNGYT